MADCTKCGKEPQQGSHPWGKACRAEYRKRGKTGNVTAVTEVTEVTDASDGNAETAGAVIGDVGQAFVPDPEQAETYAVLEAAGRRRAQVDFVGRAAQSAAGSACSGCASHAQDIAVFEEQIAGMKALAVGREQMITTLTGEVSRLEEQLRTRTQQEAEAAFERNQEPRYARRPENMPAPKKGLGGQYTPHGSNCACIGCRASRVETRDGVGVAAE